MFNGLFINSSLARYKMATCLQILQTKKRLEQLPNKPNESFNCAIIRKVFSTALTIVRIFDHGTDLRGLKLFLTRYVRNVWFSCDLICIRFTKLTLSNLCHLLDVLLNWRIRTDWPECVKIVKRRSILIHMKRFLVCKCQFSRTNAYQATWKSYPSNLFCQNSLSIPYYDLYLESFFLIKKGLKSKFIFYSCWITDCPCHVIHSCPVYKQINDTPSRSDGLFSSLGFISGLNNNQMPNFCEIWFTCKCDV